MNDLNIMTQIMDQKAKEIHESGQTLEEYLQALTSE